MVRLLAVLVLAGASASSVLAEVVAIKPFGRQVAFYTELFGPGVPGTGVMSTFLYWYSTDALMESDHPFPSLGDNVYDPEIINTRFTSLIGVDGTMITDYYYVYPLPGSGLEPAYLSRERPFFNLIDKMLLIGLAEWTYDGNIPLGTPLSYVIPAASGTFNQAEQRFYVSDGRQYQVVPEPSSLSLMLAGGAVLMAGRRRK